MSVTFAALANPHYRWLLSGNIAQFFAIAARMMLCNLLAWEITGSETSLAAINLVLAIPMFIGAIIAGAFVDRFERKRFILVGLIVIVITELSVLIALATAQLTFFHLLVATFLSGCVHPFVHPSSIAMMFSFLGREKMANGVALLSGGMNLSRIIGPAVTGGLLALWQPVVAYTSVVLLFFIALICQLQLPRDIPANNSKRTIASEVKQGISYLFGDKDILSCLLFSIPSLMLLMSTQYLLVIFANEVWQVGDAGLGFLLTAMGMGSFLGAMTVAHFGPRFSRIRLMFFSAILSAICYGVFSQSPHFMMGLIFLGLSSMTAAVMLVNNQIVIQLLAADEVRGRVSGYIIMTYSLAPLALFPLTLLAKKIGVADTVGYAAVIVLVLIVSIYFGVPRMRSIDKRLEES